MDEQHVPRSLRITAAISWRFLVVAAAIAVIALSLATLRIIFLPAIVSLILATALVPPARWLRARGVPDTLAAVTVLGGAALLLAGVVGLMAAFVVLDFEEFSGLQTSIEEGVERVTDWIVDGPIGISESEVDERIAQAREELSDNSDRIVGGAFSGALIFVEMLAGAAIALVLLFFFVKDGPAMWRQLVALFPARYRDDVRAIGDRGWTTLTGYLRGTIGVAIFDALAVAVVLVVLDVPFAVPLTVLIFFGAFIPIVGAFITGFAAVMVALAGEGPLAALVVLAAIVIVQQVEGNVLAPLLLGRSLSLHPVVVILAVTAGGVVWGIPGAFVAVPITALIASTLAYLASQDEHALAQEPGTAPPNGEAPTSEPATEGAAASDRGAT